MGSWPGVIAGGPGALAWCARWGPPGAHGGRLGLGPKIWTTADGRDWVPASVEAPSGAHAAYPGTVRDIAVGGPGYVAVGSYYRVGTGMTAAVWTSTDGRTWRLNPDQPAFERSLIDQVIPWKGGLVAVGCVRWSPMDCGPTRTWTSVDGSSWAAITPALPAGIVRLDLVSPAADRLWALGSTSDEGSYLAPDSPRPSWLTSLDGKTWETSPLQFLGGGQLHPTPGRFFFTAYEIPSGEPDYLDVPGWMDRAPGVYESTDLRTWAPLAVGRQLGEEIVAGDDSLVMLGTTGTQCWKPGRCVAAAWRSTDAGQTWHAVPVTGSTPKDRPGGTMRATAALTDGTLVAVGDLMGTDGIPVTATWVSPPQPGS